jgi:molybdopterin guanine dinucleotide-containing S/N-oxide reductase-like protein
MAVETIKTACPLDCWDCCGMIAHVEDGRLIKVEGDPDHPITQGTLCGKGRKLVDRYRHEERVLEPLKKVDGAWQPISWEQAFREIAAKMQAARDQYGATAVMHHYDYGSSGLLKVLEQRFFNLFGGFTDTVGSICWGAGLEAQKYDFGFAKSHHPDDLAAHTDLFVIWGRNVSVTNMHMMPYLKAAMKRGAELVIIDPLKTDLSDKAVKQLQPRPGSDGALALGMARHLMDRGLVNETFVQEHAVGYEKFAAYVQEWTVERAAEVTGIEAEDIRWLAERYGSGEAAATILGLGMQRYANGGNTIRLIDALVAMSGNVGRPGGGVHYGNQVHKFDYATLMAADKPKQYRAFTKITEADEILAVQGTDEPVKVLFVTRSNPVGQLPETAKTLQAYDSVDCVVVLDMFLHDTGVIADYFLPCTTVFEEEDIMYSSMWHSYMTYVNRVVEPRGNTKPDWAILQGLARELGFVEEFGEGDSVHQWMEAALKPLEGMGVTRETLQERGIVEAHVEPVAWSDYQFGTPSGKYEFYSTAAEQDGASPIPVHEEPVESPYRDKERAEKYPYHLLTIHPRRSLNSQYYNVLQMPDRPVVEISPLIARETGLRDGDLTRVYNDRGEILGTVKVTDGQHKRTIKIEEGWWGIKGTMLNTLTSNRRSDLGIGSAQYDCLVNLAKA